VPENNIAGEDIKKFRTDFEELFRSMKSNKGDNGTLADPVFFI
jgi:hypothetical protein